MARTPQIPELTSGQAHFILARLIDEGTVSATDVRRVLGQMWAELNFIERRLSELRAAAEPLRHPVRAARSVTTKMKSAAKRVMSAERKASMRMQGEYLGLLTQIPKNGRSKYQRIAKTEGREKAIDAMKTALDK
jgi:hypothetical protein